MKFQNFKINFKKKKKSKKTSEAQKNRTKVPDSQVQVTSQASAVRRGGAPDRVLSMIM